VKIVALGSADAFCSEGRGHTSWLVEDEQGAYAVDFGATALQAMKRLRKEELGAVYFTHLHGDHVAGWPFLLVDAVYRARRTAPLAVCGPPGTRQTLQTLWAACYATAASEPLPFSLEVHELSPGQSAQVAGRTVTAFAARHMRPPHVALSLRIGGLAFSGDTGAHEGLAALTEGARAFCTECTNLAPGDEKHLSWAELRELLPRLGVRRVLLGHLGSDARAARERIEDEARALGLDLHLCDDLDEILC
jgi:ribonuclease BN (tRNA processing enzyme)